MERNIIPAPGALEVAAQEPEMMTEIPVEGPIGREEVAEAIQRLQRYKEGKTNLEQRVVQDEQWYKLRHWEVMRKGKGKQNAADPAPASAWLFNAISNKHADAMDNYPEPVVLPRERMDEDSAKTLTAILPVIMERNHFDQTYSDNWWEKLKHGTCVYGIGWDQSLENGVGDVAITQIDLLNIFWQPGITDLQKSRDIFIVSLEDTKNLEEMYPGKEIKGGDAIDVAEYIYDDTVETQDKSLVVDWYYKKRMPGGRCVLHYCKFVGSTILFASENDPAYQEKGWYHHGLYPIVADTLFPEKGTPIGWGYVALCKDPQLYIDNLSANILKNAMMSTNPRYFYSEGCAINKEDFLDWSNPLIPVNGSLDQNYLRQVEVGGLTGNILNVYQMKVDEMKETANNRDVSSGSTSGGVTAAAAIAALQEAGNKGSRDMIAASYRSMVQIYSQVIELLRQFYDGTRSFRIVGQDMMTPEFVDFSNRAIVAQQTGVNAAGEYLYRVPVFDLKVKAQRRNPYSQLSQNEMAKELYSMGFFNPQMAQPALGALEMMEFEGKDKVREFVMRGQTLQNMVQLYAQQLALLTGQAPVQGGEPGQTARTESGGRTMASRSENSKAQAQTPYAQRLAGAAKPRVEGTA